MSINNFILRIAEWMKRDWYLERNATEASDRVVQESFQIEYDLNSYITADANVPYSNLGRLTNNLFTALAECFMNDNNVINFGISERGS